MSLGAFAIGTTEFASMGLLPQIARDLAVSIPQAGMLITLYALGVVIGAPLVTIAAVRIPRARLLVLLIALIGVGNLLSAIAPDFTVLASARFLAGLPHGRSEEHTSELQSRGHLVCRLLLEQKNRREVADYAAVGLGGGHGAPDGA